MRRSATKARLVFRQKLALGCGKLRDGVIWRVPVSERYPNGIRYRLALVEPLTGKVLVLFDNHFPKGHHKHLKNGAEVIYNFTSVESLVDDYLKAIEDEENKT